MPRLEEAPSNVAAPSAGSQAPLDAKRRAEYATAIDIILKHAATTPEVIELCKDTRVLGKGDFKALLKWRGKLQEYFKALEDEAKKADGRWEAEEKARKQRELEKAMEAELDRPTLSAEENFERELKELRIKKLLEAKKEKKKKREMKAKLNKRTLVNAHNLKESAELVGSDAGGATTSSLASTGGVGGEEGLFTLRSIKSKDALDYVAETEGTGGKTKKQKAADGDEEMASDDEDDEEDEDEEELYASILQEQNEAFEASMGKGSRNRAGPHNMYEDQEEALLAKIRARDARKAGSSLSTESGVISLGNVRGDDTDGSYYSKLENDLDFMYESPTHTVQRGERGALQSLRANALVRGAVCCLSVSDLGGGSGMSHTRSAETLRARTGMEDRSWT